MSELTESIDLFKKSITDLKIDIHNDDKWPIIADSILKGKSIDFIYHFWLNLEQFFLEYETNNGHCHKGQIYWQLTSIALQKGDIDKCFDFLNKCNHEDDIRDKSVFTAAKGLLSIIHPLFYRFSDNPANKMTIEIKDLYNSLNPSDKLTFASQLFESHNNCATHKIVYILPDYFTFIADERLRKIMFDTYVEIQNIIQHPSNTYYASIFSIGSVIETMLDDLFLRNSSEIWKLFHNNESIQTKITSPNSPLHSVEYPLQTTLNTKIAALRMLDEENIRPLPRYTLLQLTLIGEYRDLIHTRRRLNFQFNANYYVATFLFSMISQIAGNLWSEVIIKRLT
jgi:hypothetical protein